MARNFQRTRRYLLVLTVSALCLAGTAGAQVHPGAPRYVILKLDDVVQSNHPNEAISPRWQRVADFLDQRHLKSSFGIIGASLENDNPKYFDWIKKIHASGQVEFWLHGYGERSSAEGLGEFEHGTAEEQAIPLLKTEALANQKLGFPLVAFGAHWSAFNEETEKAVESVPDIKIWLYGPADSRYFTRVSIPRYMALENPNPFNPNFDNFKARYDKVGRNREVLLLQGHPDQWKDDVKWQGFVQIVDFLQAQGYIFTTPSEYAKMHGLLP